MAYDSKNHHYVPRFYLKNFACDSDKPQVFSMSKDFTIHDESSPIDNICAKKNYNTAQQETKQSQLEAKHARILRELIKTPNPETFNQSREFMEFVSFMMGNNIHIRTGINRSFGEELYDYMIREEFPSEIISIDMEYRGQLDTSIAFANCVFHEFQSWKFAWNWPISGGKVYITSDSPVAILNPNNIFTHGEISVGFRNLRVNFGDGKPVSKDRMAMDVGLDWAFDDVSFGQDAMMIFPVTPYICLLGFSDSERYARFMNRTPSKKDNSISTINLIIHDQCNRVAYSHSKDVLEITKINKPRFVRYCKHNSFAPSFDTAIGIIGT